MTRSDSYYNVAIPTPRSFKASASLSIGGKSMGDGSYWCTFEFYMSQTMYRLPVYEYCNGESNRRYYLLGGD